MKDLKTQFGESMSADLFANIWIFAMNDETRITAGKFAIVPAEKYEALLTALTGIMNSMKTHPDCEPHSEFECMVERCEDVLNALK